MTDAEKTIVRKVLRDLQDAATTANIAYDADRGFKRAVGEAADRLESAARELRDVLG